MTVQGEDTASSPVDRDMADQQFTELFREYAPRLRSFIWHRLDLSEAQLAEDLTQETFIELWRRYLLADRGPIEEPFGLLCAIARSQIGQHFQRKASFERALDFTDAANTPILATGHAYALERPDTAGLVRDLDVAMETMRAASQTWRDAHKASHVVRTMLQRPNLISETRTALQQQLTEADAREDAKLNSFRTTCTTVGRLRAELESVAGPHWRSAIGLPVNPALSAVKAGAYRNDRSVSHCPDGHLLDLNNTHFEEDGSRICRACKSAQYAARRTPAGPVRTISEDVLDKARTMLADPACASLSLAAIAKRLGISHATISQRLPGQVAARRSLDVIDPTVIAAARQMLLDPSVTLTIAQIAESAGCGVKTIVRHLKPELAARKARTRKAVSVGTAR